MASDLALFVLCGLLQWGYQWILNIFLRNWKSSYIAIKRKWQNWSALRMSLMIGGAGVTQAQAATLG